MGRVRTVILGTLLALGPAVLAVGSAAPAHAAPEPPAPTTPLPPHGVDPFTQCPPVGTNTGCALLLVINPDGTVTVLTDPSQGPFDGVEDTLVGVQNNASFPVTFLTLNGVTTPVPTFGFDGDGLCNQGNSPAGCPFGPTGYEGPNTSFSNISADMADGVVNFTGGLAPGASAFFSLEGVVTAQSVVVPPITPPVTPPVTPLLVVGPVAAFTG